MSGMTSRVAEALPVVLSSQSCSPTRLKSLWRNPMTAPPGATLTAHAAPVAQWIEQRITSLRRQTSFGKRAGDAVVVIKKPAPSLTKT
jgi:hypothetical protein